MLNKYFYIIFFLAWLWLKDHNENKAICLFCVILAMLFFISLILLLTSTIFLLLLLLLFVVNFFFFFNVWLFNFFVPIWSFCFYGKIKLTYLLTYLYISCYFLLPYIRLNFREFRSEDMMKILPKESLLTNSHDTNYNQLNLDLRTNFIPRKL